MFHPPRKTSRLTWWIIVLFLLSNLPAIAVAVFLAIFGNYNGDFLFGDNPIRVIHIDQFGYFRYEEAFRDRKVYFICQILIPLEYSGVLLIAIPVCIALDRQKLFLARTAVRRCREQRWLDRYAHTACPECGYDIRATPDNCPECGLPLCHLAEVNREIVIERCKSVGIAAPFQNKQESASQRLPTIT